MTRLEARKNRKPEVGIRVFSVLATETVPRPARRNLLITFQARMSKPAESSFLMERGDISYFFYDPDTTFRIRRGKLEEHRNGNTQVHPGNPLQKLKSLLESYQPEATDGVGVPAFAQSAVGYLGYDCVRYLESIPLPLPEAGEDEARFAIYRKAVVFDAKGGRATLVVNGFDPAQRKNAASELKQLRRVFRQAVAASEKTRPARRSRSDAEAEVPSLDLSRFQTQVSQIKEHIREGDIFQCVISRRMEYPTRASSLEIFQKLRAISPAPYLYHFTGEGQALLGASPELLVRVENRRVETCPIAGTRPRGKTPAEDFRRERQLKRSVKERAEHLMLVDLSRNDLGRVSEPGSVQVDQFMKVERFSHVMHLVSLVSGKLSPSHSALSALFACFPAGTLTGAPKIRAMQILSALEGIRRGAYGGAVVMLDFAGQLDSCITIRSLVVQGGKVSIQAGAGIVQDSQAARELEEIASKSRAARKALRSAEENP